MAPLRNHPHSVKEIVVLNVNDGDPLHDHPEVRQVRILQLTRSLI
jgi:hypothetical protein